MFPLSQLLRTLDTASPADCNSTLHIFQVFFFLFLFFFHFRLRVEGNAARLLKKAFAYLNVKKARKVKALVRVHRRRGGRSSGGSCSGGSLHLSRRRVRWGRRPSQQQGALRKWHFLQRRISFLMEILTFSFQLQSRQLAERSEVRVGLVVRGPAD